MNGRRKVQAKEMARNGVMAKKKITAHQSRTVVDSGKIGALQVGSNGRSRAEETERIVLKISK